MMNFIIAIVIIVLFYAAGSMWMERNAYLMLYHDYRVMCEEAETIFDDIANTYPDVSHYGSYRQWRQAMSQLQIEISEDKQ